MDDIDLVAVELFVADVIVIDHDTTFDSKNMDVLRTHQEELLLRWVGRLGF